MEATQNLPKSGTRVRLGQSVERYPHFIAREGLMGTVTEATEDLVCVKMDEHLVGAEEWDNDVCFTPEDADFVEGDGVAAAFHDSCEVL